jgi:hypothetical protein
VHHGKQFRLQIRQQAQDSLGLAGVWHVAASGPCCDCCIAFRVGSIRSDVVCREFGLSGRKVSSWQFKTCKICGIDDVAHSPSENETNSG